MNIKKGFTLIEIICTMAVISIITSVILLETKNYEKFRNEIDNKYCSDEIICFINEIRENCRANEQPGQIMAYEKSNEILFYRSTVLKDKINLPKGFCITSNNAVTTDHLIYLDADGTITTPCTLQYMDKNSEIHEITIGVGTEYVQVHK